MILIKSDADCQKQNKQQLRAQSPAPAVYLHNQKIRYATGCAQQSSRLPTRHRRRRSRRFLYFLFAYLNVVADESGFALEGARQRALRQLEAERKLVQAPRKDGHGALRLV